MQPLDIVGYRKKLEKNFLYRFLTNLRFRLDLMRVMKTIDSAKFNMLYEKYKDVAPDPGYSKYLDIKKWMHKTLWRVYILSLNESSPKKILDLGTGTGYFPYLCQFYGHKVKSLDIDTDPMFNDLVKFLGIDRVTFRIKENSPLPDFGEKYDIVTGFMVCFNNHKEKNVWTRNEWNYFLNHLYSKHTNPNATAFFTMNAEPNTNEWYTKNLLEFFLSKGAQVDGQRVYFPSLEPFRNL